MSGAATVTVAEHASVQVNAATHSFTLDASNLAYQKLVAGQSQAVTVNYGVSDGAATTAASTSLTCPRLALSSLRSGDFLFV